MRSINKIIVHWSASVNATTDSMRDYHMNFRRYSDIGYHFVIERDSTIVEGRPVEKVGAHCLSENRDSLGVCVVADKFNPPTSAQFDSLDYLLNRLIVVYHLSKDCVFPHFHFAKTLCPGCEIAKFIGEFKYEN